MKFIANGNPDYLGKQYNDDNNALIKVPIYAGYRKTSNTQMQVTASLRWDIPFVKGLWAKALVVMTRNSIIQRVQKTISDLSYDKANGTYSVANTSAMSSITEWRSDTANSYNPAFFKLCRISSRTSIM